MPYHNRMHASDVLLSMHWLLERAGAKPGATAAGRQLPWQPLEMLAALFAAAAHDVDHPGVNNPFLSRDLSPLALRYNDKSILENHHAATGFALMTAEGSNVLRGLGRDAATDLFWQFREVIGVPRACPPPAFWVSPSPSSAAATVGSQVPRLWGLSLVLADRA